MNERDAQAACAKLADMLRSTDLVWLLEETEDEIRQGKPSEKKIRVQESEELVSVPAESESRRQRPTTFVESVEFTSVEKLEVLISAIERAVVEPALMESGIASVLNSSTGTPTREPVDSLNLYFKFLPEEGQRGGRSSSHQERERRRNVGEKLALLIARFRKEGMYAAH